LVWSAARGRERRSLLVSSGNVWLSHILIVALWYWDLNRNHPCSRARAQRKKPDVLFPGGDVAGPADEEWEPHFVDYLCLAHTTVTAVSPWSAPVASCGFSRWSKLAVLLHSTI
jgi:hypothetical protein